MTETHGAITGTSTGTYYDLPVVKAAPWKWYVPTYFYLGGLAGAASTMGLERIAAAAEGAGAACLIADLGKPMRFIYMMRVFRPTSPMNMGTWILSAATATTGLSLWAPNKVTRVASAVTGAMLSTYTGVLVGNTATPVWNRSRRVLPLFFAASSAASLGSLLEVLGQPRRRYSMIAKTAEVIGGAVVERAGGAVLRDNKLWRRSRWLGLASLAATAFNRPRLAGVLGTASALLGRFAIMDAGRASANDPYETLRA
ncbi:MAG TPA: hypothetical protein VLT45_27750 [Kofleriaceae bacterium]|nr:hypothetical protein [Kofleriaceae bacterium]